MKEKQQRETKPQKKSYTKPEVKQVQLKPEEAVLGGCKSVSASNSPNIGGTCSTPGNCYTLAS